MSKTIKKNYTNKLKILYYEKFKRYYIRKISNQ